MQHQVAVHESKTSEKVVQFIDEDLLDDEIRDLIKDGCLWGIYYGESGNIVAEDIWGDVHEDIENNSI